jgi:hypothetical protein
VPIDQVKKAVTILTNVFSPLKMAAARIICPNCNYGGKPKYRTSPVAWWLLWFFVGGFFVSLRRLRRLRGHLIAGQKSAEGIVGYVVGQVSEALQQPKGGDNG